jgi:hypothetical protein
MVVAASGIVDYARTPTDLTSGADQPVAELWHRAARLSPVAGASNSARGISCGMSAALIVSARAMKPLTVNDLKRSVDPRCEAAW